MDTIEFREQLKQRTKAFALRVIRLYQSLATNSESQIIGETIIAFGNVCCGKLG